MNDKAITAVGRNPLLIGYNYPWAFNKYGLYFGPHQRENETPAPTNPLDAWTTYFAKNIVDLRDNYGVRVLRIFLLCNAHNWGDVDAAGLWQPPKALHPKFLTDLEAMLGAVRDAGMMVIPSLLDFGIAAPGVRSEKRHRIVSDPAMSTIFYEQVLEPFLVTSKKFPHTIWAWEVMNEPSWMTANIWPTKDVVRSAVSVRELNTFLDGAIARIAKHEHLSTVGHRYFRDLSKYSTGDVHQFHFYPAYRLHVITPLTDPAELPVYDVDTRAILGEFGASATHGDSWKELNGADGPTARERVLERFKGAEAKNYRLAMLWPDGDWDGNLAGDNLKLSAEAAAGLKAFAATRTKP